MSADPQIFVLDSFALLAYLGGEVGMEPVLEVLEAAFNGTNRVFCSWINVGEVLYITEREVGLPQAQAVLAAIEQLPIELLPVSKEAVLAAAHVKANYSIAYADAFAVAAAQELNGVVLTGDPEFEAVEKIISVKWLTRGE